MKRLIAIAAFALAALTACTISPPVVTAKAPAFDGNSQNSGFLGFLPDGGGHITPGAAERYDALRRAYGGAFLPHLVDSKGLTKLADGTYEIDAEHLTKFDMMARMDASGWSKTPP